MNKDVSMSILSPGVHYLKQFIVVLMEHFMNLFNWLYKKSFSHSHIFNWKTLNRRL